MGIQMGIRLTRRRCRIALGLGSQETWIGFLALGPLFLLLFTGLYLFVQPYAAKWRRRAA